MNTNRFRIAEPGLSPLKAFARGVGNLLDIAGTRGSGVREAIRSKTVESALRSDWEAIGRDFWHVLDEFDQEVKSGARQV